MARTDETALLLQISARMDGFEKSLDRAAGIVKKKTKEMEESASNLEKFFGKPSLARAVDKTFDATRFKVLDSGTARVGVFGSALESLGPAGLGAAAGIGAAMSALAMAREAAAFADDLADTANRLHVTTDALQEYRYAIHAAGGESKGADDALESFSITLGKAQQGLAKAKKGFVALGLGDQIKDFRTVDEALRAVTEKISNLGSNAQKDAIIDQLGLTGLKPLIDEGTDAMSNLLAEAHKVGYVMDKDLIAKGGQLNDEIEALSVAVKVNLMSSFVGLGPVLKWILERVRDITSAFADVIEGFKTIKISDVGNAAMNAMMHPGTAPVVFAQDLLRTAHERRMAAAKQRKAEPAFIPAMGTGTLEDQSSGGGGRRRSRSSRSRVEKEPLIKEMYLFDQEVYDLVEHIRYNTSVIEKANNTPADFQTRISDLTSTGDMQQQLVDSMDAARQSTHDAIYDGVMGGLEAGFTGGVPEMAAYLKDQVVRSLMSAIAESITTSLMAKSGGGGFIGTALSLFGFAGGTNYAPGGLAVVGEKGPEIVNLPRGSQVVPNNIASTMNQVGQSRAQGTTVIQPFHFDLRGAVMTQDLLNQMNQIGAQAAAAGAQQGSAMAVSRIYTRARNKLGR